MDKASEYRSYAEAAVELAARSNDDAYRAIMLKIAQGWLDLSQQVEKLGAKAERWTAADENGH
jgi:hypothetical protein